MKHLERAYIGNNFLPWYLVILVLILFIQTISANFFFAIEFSAGITDKNVILLFLLLPFAISLIIFGILTQVIHKRSVIEVINGRKSIRWKRLFVGFIVWFILSAVTALISYFYAPDSFVFQFNLAKFIPLLLITILFIPLQAAFEEIIFRGYIMQGVATFTQSRWIALIFSSLLFAFLHMNNPEVDKYGQIMFFSYLVIALTWGITTLLDDGAELAIGMHTANNLFISLFSTEEGAAFETHAIFETTNSDPELGLVVLCLSGLIAIAFFYKKYRWKFSILNKKVENPANKTSSVS